MLPFGAWMRSAFSEADGTGSSSRILFASAMGITLGLVVTICSIHLRQHVDPVITKGTLDGFRDLVGISWGPYAANKIATAATNVFGNKNATTTGEPSEH